MNHRDNPESEEMVRRYHRYPIWSLVALAGFGVCIGRFTYWPKRGSPYIDSSAVLLGAVVTGVCLWTFLRCPFRHWFVKIVTFILLLAALACDLFIALNISPNFH
jgi:hypothetical protein